MLLPLQSRRRREKAHKLFMNSPKAEMDENCKLKFGVEIAFT